MDLDIILHDIIKIYLVLRKYKNNFVVNIKQTL